jgi:dihydrofolate reductase
MIISFIAAVSENNAIGKNNDLPWRLPEDLKFFKRTTLGKPVIMGRRTYESFGKPLPGRLNIVISGNKDLALPEGVQVSDDINATLERLQNDNVEEAFIIGGGTIFKETLPLADRLYITRVHTVIPDADTFFPAIDHTHWKLVWEEDHNADDKHAYTFTFQKFERLEL